MKRKIVATLLAGVLILGSSVSTMATSADDTITVYLDVENTFAYDMNTLPANISYVKEPIKLEVETGTTVMGALIEAGLTPKKLNSTKTALDNCTSASKYFDSLPASGNLSGSTVLSANNAYCYAEINVIKTDYYDKARDYYGDMWEYIADMYAFEAGWKSTAEVAFSGYLTSADYNYYSGWMFTINNLMNEGDIWYSAGSVLDDGDVVRVEWTNGGGYDMGFPVQVTDETYEFTNLPSSVNRIDKTDLLTTLAEANAVGSTVTGSAAYVTATNLMKDKSATQEACDAAVIALQALLPSA